MIDTHTHLYAAEFAPDRELLIRKALSGGITRFYLPNIDSGSIEGMLALEKQFPENCFAMMGLHPCSVNATVNKELEVVRQWLDRRKFIAVGEIGIDLYWDKTYLREQEMAFRTQLEWAIEFGYPVSIHCREAFNEIYRILGSMTVRPKAVFHCFSGNAEQAAMIVALGNFKLGIGGVVTFKNSGLDKVIETVDLEHLVLETDAPYLAPVPFRGKRNEPAYMLEVARKIALLKNTTMAEVEKVTTKSAEFIFNK